MYYECLIFTGSTKILAIYIEPPADVRSVPQNYTVHCITVKNSKTVLMSLGQKSVYMPNDTSSIINSDMGDHTLAISWGADRVLMDSTEIVAQGVTKNNGDHGWTCTDEMDSFLQTYIKGYI